MSQEIASPDILVTATCFYVPTRYFGALVVGLFGIGLAAQLDARNRTPMVAQLM